MKKIMSVIIALVCFVAANAQEPVTDSQIITVEHVSRDESYKVVETITNYGSDEPIVRKYQIQEGKDCWICIGKTVQGSAGFYDEILMFKEERNGMLQPETDIRNVLKRREQKTNHKYSGLSGMWTIDPSPDDDTVEISVRFDKDGFCAGTGVDKPMGNYGRFNITGCVSEKTEGFVVTFIENREYGKNRYYEVPIGDMTREAFNGVARDLDDDDTGYKVFVQRVEKLAVK